jgi:TonB family protein
MSVFEMAGKELCIALSIFLTLGSAKAAFAAESPTSSASTKTQAPTSKDVNESVKKRRAYNGLLDDLWSEIMRSWGSPAGDDFAETQLVVGFQLDHQGKVSDIHVEKSSGFFLVDHFAMQAIEQAGPFTRQLPTKVVQINATFRVNKGALTLRVSLPDLGIPDSLALDPTCFRQIAEGDVVASAEKLSSPNSETQRQALLFLKSLGVKASAAVPAVSKLLKSKDAGVRELALSTLEQMGPTGTAALPALIQLLQISGEDEDRRKATAVVGAMGAAGDPAAPALLEILRNSDNGYLRSDAAMALKKMGPERMRSAIAIIVEGIGDFHSIARGTLPDFGAEAVPALIEAIGASSPDGRRNIAQTLRDMPTVAAPAVPALIGLVHDHSEEVQEDAIDALAAIGPAAKDAVPDLIEALKSDRPVIHSHAVSALGSIGAAARDALPVLREDLKLENQDDRRSAQDAIRLIETAS